MKTRRIPAIARKLRPSICSSTIAAAVMVISHLSPLAQMAVADTYTTLFGQQQLEPGLLSGNTGLTMSGGGQLLLQNAGNTYTGTTTINDGSLSITSAGALGLDASAIVIGSLPFNGNFFDTTAGGGGGNLTVGGGITLTRNLNMRGNGPSGLGGALTNVGNNIFSGTITTSASTTLHSTYGTATLSGPLTFAANSTTTLGGNANWVLSGAIGATTGGLAKTDSGSLELTNTNLYSGTTAISGGFLRVGSSASLGTSTSNSAISISTGTLEIRSDAPDFSTKGLSISGTSTLVLDHAVGSSVLNQTAVFKNFSQSTNASSTINGRNGYWVTFNAVSGTTTSSQTYTNNANGLVTFIGNLWNQTSTTAANSVTLGGTGNTQINGNIIANALFAHSLTKSGTGTLTIQATGAGSTYTGLTNISDGTVAINSITALNNAATGAASQINMGTTTTAGTLTFTGSGAAADYTVAKTVNLAGTTGGATINANQTGTNPVILSANFAATGGLITDAKTLTLGGTNAADNAVNGIISNNAAGGTVNLAKTGSGTWVLAGTNTYTGSTLISAGTLKLKAAAGGSTVLVDNTAVGFAVNATTQTAGGTLDLVGAPSVASNEVAGPLDLVAGASTVRVTPGAGGSASLTFASVGTAQTTTASSTASSTVTVASTAGLVPGMAFTGTGVTTNAKWSVFAFADRALKDERKSHVRTKE